MPKAAMNKDDATMLRKDYVGPPGQVFPVKAKTISQAM